MYQNHLSLLLHQFYHQTGEQYSLSQLLNDTDYRNKALQQQKLYGVVATRRLVKRIHDFEDILHHEFRVDYLSKTNKHSTNSWHLTIFALVCLSFAVSALAIADDIKSNRKEVITFQAE